MQAVAESGAQLLPIDSEHNAMFQCLPIDYSCDRSRGMSAVGVKRILLTGSGGPFRTTPLHELAAMTPDQACAHPNWKMGRKISVDSATMMNKGLELIEACWLFNVSPQQIEIVLHPQSIIHSMVEYIDGSVLAQMGNPDMRTPIAYGLAWPERIAAGVSSLDLITQARLDFSAPDEQRFPCLRLAREALTTGGTAMAALNAANEVAVQSFLDGQIAFTQIPVVIEKVLAAVTIQEPVNLGVVEAADFSARELARGFLFDA
jgi:1-deoxy-D-xylulose-5-phosphate reductoisomerase